MKTTLTTNLCERCLALLLALLSARAGAAQFVDIVAKIDAISWPGGMIETRKIYTTHCVIGLETWFFEGDFRDNAIIGNWWIGSNVIHRAVGTKPSVIVAQEAGTLGTNHGLTVVNSSPDGRPERVLGFDNVPWLAFCSGPFLKTKGRVVPLPIGVPTWKFTPDYSDTTVVFNDELGLPQHMEFHTPDKQLVLQYEVLQSTNFLGWNFPLQFKIFESRLGFDGTLVRHGQTLGKVTSIRPGTEPEIPADVLTNFVFSNFSITNPFPNQLRRFIPQKR
jgi:hypothetical protein